MLVEDELKAFIKSEYKSMLAFSKAVGIPYPTLDSMFKRGIMNAGAQNVLKMCAFLGISADSLGDGEIVARDTSGLKLSTHEVELIQKYRALDERGKRAVDETLEREYGYTKPFEQDSSNAIGAG